MTWIEKIRLWRQSRHTKSTLAIIITAAVLIELVSAVQYWYAREGIREEVTHRAESELKAKNLEIEKVTSAVEAVSRSTLWMIEKNINNPKEIEEILRETISNNDLLKGCGIGFKPNYFSSYGHWYEPYANRLADGSVETLQIGNKNHDYTVSEWYIIPMKTGKGYWTEPYYDEAGGKTLMVSYVQPVRNDKDSIVAVFGVDVELNWLSNLINASHIYPSSYNIMVSRQGNLVACPVESLVMKRSLQEVTARIKDTAAMNVNQQMLEGISGQATIIDENGEKNYVFFAPISRDSTLSKGEQLGWSMAVVCSDKEIYYGLRQVGFNLMLLMIAGMALLTYIIVHSIHGFRKLHAIESEKERIANELGVAQRIQNAMLPKTFPPYPDRTDLDIYASLKPAREVGGDFYDYFQRDEKLFFCIGDVSGKGVPAALVMAMAQSVFRMLVARESSPERIVEQMNETLARDNDYNIFITLFIGVLDLPTGRLRYCNAGHKAPVIVYGAARDEHLVEEESNDTQCTTHSDLPCDSNLPVGALDGWEYTLQEEVLKPETTLFLYTDGLTEAENAYHEQFGKHRMQEVMTDMAGEESITSETLVKKMDGAVHRFVADTEQSDDLTMLAIKFMHYPSAVLLHESITLSNDVNEVPQLTEFVEKACETVNLDTTVIMQVNLAMEEAVVNVMNYAYPEGHKGEIGVVAEADDKRLKFIITDVGAPFDPTTYKKVDTTLSAEERNIGGLGIHLMRRYMDSINYERIEGKNILTLRKKLK